ncbi:hypothetical protein B296_00035342, partial [Ensete ventricosum]
EKQRNREGRDSGGRRLQVATSATNDNVANRGRTRQQRGPTRARLWQWRRGTRDEEEAQARCPTSDGCGCCCYRWRTRNEGSVDGAAGEAVKEAGEEGTNMRAATGEAATEGQRRPMSVERRGGRGQWDTLYQSYVLTKDWSCFVKEKKLDAATASSSSLFPGRLSSPPWRLHPGETSVARG